MKTPLWAQNLIIEAMIYIESERPLPDIVWRKARHRENTGGVCHKNHITITTGTNRIDCKLVILHELAHWCLPWPENHSDTFWDLAWQLYRWAKLPMRYCKQREQEYRVGALAAYHRLKGKA